MQQEPSRGGANVEPPAGYVEQPLSDRWDWLDVFTYPRADPGGFVVLVIVVTALLYRLGRRVTKWFFVSVAAVVMVLAVAQLVVMDPGGPRFSVPPWSAS